MKVRLSYVLLELRKVSLIPDNHTEAVRAFEAIMRPKGSWVKPKYVRVAKKSHVRIKKSARTIESIEILPLYIPSQ